MEEGKGDLHVGEKTTAEKISKFLIERYDRKQDTKLFLSKKNQALKMNLDQGIAMLIAHAPGYELPKPRWVSFKRSASAFLEDNQCFEFLFSKL